MTRTPRRAGISVATVVEHGPANSSRAGVRDNNSTSQSWASARSTLPTLAGLECSTRAVPFGTETHWQDLR